MSSFQQNTIVLEGSIKSGGEAIGILTVSQKCGSKEQVCPFSLFQNKVDDLYKFRDHYFENHSIDSAINRNADTQNELDKLLKLFDQYEGIVG